MKALTSEREQQDLLEQQEQAKEIQFFRATPNRTGEAQ